MSYATVVGHHPDIDDYTDYRAKVMEHRELDAMEDAVCECGAVYVQDCDCFDRNMDYYEEDEQWVS